MCSLHDIQSILRRGGEDALVYRSQDLTSKQLQEISERAGVHLLDMSVTRTVDQSLVHATIEVMEGAPRPPRVPIPRRRAR